MYVIIFYICVFFFDEIFFCVFFKFFYGFIWLFFVIFLGYCVFGIVVKFFSGWYFKLEICFFFCFDFFDKVFVIKIWFVMCIFG